MERNSNFNLQERFDLWSNDLNSKPYITEVDFEELRAHLCDIIEDLKKAGLDDDEAFLVASKRLGNLDDLAEDYLQSNNNILQMRKSLAILAGVLLYFLSFYFIKLTSKILIITLISINKMSEEIVLWGVRYLISWCFIVIVFLVSIFLMENRTFSIIEKIKLKPIHTISILLTTIILAVADFSISPFIKKGFGDNFALKDKYAHMNIYFDIGFPLIMCICFIFIYYKYYFKTKVF